MIFKLIESQTSLSGKKLHVDMPFKSTISAFTNKESISFDSDFSKSLEDDTKSLESFKQALVDGIPAEDALRTHMAGASVQASSFAEDLKVLSAEYLKSNDVVADFETKQKLSEVSLIATNKSLANCSSLINEYNSDCKNVGLTQQQFIESVGSSNRVMGNYLAGLNGAKASFGGYTKALVGAKLQTIGLQVASTALNAIIGVGVGLAISAAIKGIDYLIHRTDNLIQKGEDAANTITSIGDSYKSAKSTVDECTDSFIKLSKGVDSVTGKNLTLSDGDYQEFLSISNQLAETFPTLTRHYDENGNAIVKLNGDAETITKTLEGLLETERQLANQEIVENLPDLFKGIKAKSDKYQNEINMVSNNLESLQDVVDMSNGDFELKIGTTWKPTSLSTDDYLEFQRIIDDSGLLTHSLYEDNFNNIATDYENQSYLKITVE